MKEVGRALYGSQNYGLSNENSDKDYKVFLCPSFDDLYRGHKADKGDLPKGFDAEHYSVLDVRKFAELVKVGNVNCLEYLFSLELTGNDKFLEWCGVAQLFFNQGYLAMVWPTFFSSLEGMVKNSLDRYGVSRKSMSRAYFLYKFAETVSKDNFQVFNSTWRANNWNKTVYEMRFDDTVYLPTQEDVFRALNDLRVETTNKVKAYQNNELLKYDLVEQMKGFVYHEVL